MTAAEESAAEGAPVRVLCIDDNRALARLLQRRLEKDGFAVDLAEDGASGLRRVREAPYDALIIDYQMPGMDGLEVLSALAADGPALATVMVTGAGDEDIAVQAMKAGAGDYLAKDPAGTYLDILPTVLRRLLARRRIERALARQTEILETTLASVDQGLSVFDNDLRLVICNDRYVDLFDFPEHLVRVGTPFEALIRYNAERGEYGPGDPEAQIAERIANARASRVHRYEHARPDGRVIEVRGAPAMGGGFAATYTDITERKRRERALTESEARKSAILAAALDAIVTIDDTGRIVEFNPAAERTFGRARADALGKAMADLLIPPEHRGRHHVGLRHLRTTGHGPILDRRIEVEALRADGSRFPVEMAVTAEKVGERSVFTAFMRDITDRQRCDLALQASETLCRTIVEAAAEGFFRVDGTGVVVDANAALCTLLRCSADDLVGKPLAEAIDSGERLDDRTAGAHHVVETTLATADGRAVPVCIRIARLGDQDGTASGLAAFVTDLTVGKDTE